MAAVGMNRQECAALRSRGTELGQRSRRARHHAAEARAAAVAAIPSPKPAVPVSREGALQSCLIELRETERSLTVAVSDVRIERARVVALLDELARRRTVIRPGPRGVLPFRRP